MYLSCILGTNLYASCSFDFANKNYFWQIIGWGLWRAVPSPQIMKFKNMHFDWSKDFLSSQKVRNECKQHDVHDSDIIYYIKTYRDPKLMYFQLVPVFCRCPTVIFKLWSSVIGHCLKLFCAVFPVSDRQHDCRAVVCEYYCHLLLHSIHSLSLWQLEKASYPGYTHDICVLVLSIHDCVCHANWCFKCKYVCLWFVVYMSAVLKHSNFCNRKGNNCLLY